MTPYILIFFSFLGGTDNLLLARERITDTLIGSAIALFANYFILPTWEYQQLKSFMREVLIANYQYLLNVADTLNGKPFDVTKYKLTRKAVYVGSANIGSTFQRMLSEPKSKQKNIKELHQFVVLNHILSSYVATLISTLQQMEVKVSHVQHIKLVRQSLYNLSEVIHQMDQPNFSVFKEAEIPTLTTTEISESSNQDIRLLTEQLELVKTTTGDIQKISSAFNQN
jgi:uncharacterized membrane protein YccC